MDFYVGPGGNDAWDGMSWPTRRLTINAGLGAGLSAGDTLYVGPGVYREEVYLGGFGYVHGWSNEGTITVTRGSKVVTGVDTHWLAQGLAPGDVLYVSYLSSGQGDVNGPAPGDVLTDAGSNFDAAAIGMCINMHESGGGADGGSFQITAVAGNTITYNDLNGIGYPAAAQNSYDYTVPSMEGSYEIESVESNTQLTLKRRWSGPTYAGIASGATEDLKDFTLWRPIYLIGDETGAHTDGVGGVCRITGSDDDISISVARDSDYGITNKHAGVPGRSYWTIRGFQIDTVGDTAIFMQDAIGITVENIRTLAAPSKHIHFLHAGYRSTVRRCIGFGGDDATGVQFDDISVRWSGHSHIENCVMACFTPFRVEYFANFTIKNCASWMTSQTFLQTSGQEIGGCVFVINCETHYTENIALWPAAAGQILVDWTNFWDNFNDIWVGRLVKGANCTSFLHLPDLPILVDGYRYPLRFYPPSEWWAGRALQGLYPANEDVYGVARPTDDDKISWGPQQEYHHERDTAITYGGAEACLLHPDARTTQFRAPITGVPITVTVQVQREANYAGDLPKLVVHQPGQDDVEDVASGAVEAWELLSVDYEPHVYPPLVWIELVSDNVAASGDHAVRWQLIPIVVTPT